MTTYFWSRYNSLKLGHGEIQILTIIILRALFVMLKKITSKRILKQYVILVYNEANSKGAHLLSSQRDGVGH